MKAFYTRAKDNRQVQCNPIFEEMKAKAKVSLESETKSRIYAQRKIDVESVFGHIKGNSRSVDFYCEDLIRSTQSLGLWHWYKIS
ncbi:transposase [Paenisporosarcina sp. TG-14]|uniref:transposase n=1 Tax=Paenisporosarcina sp. TG-14 TaxID=1231057 RepID=UPI0009DB4617